MYIATLVWALSACFVASGSLQWWQKTVVYQIYPRSFMDSDGDGIGDLKGIEQKVGYLKELGVGAVWLSPIYKSPMADFGYDISDFREIEPMFGTMQDFDNLLQALHKLGIKLIMDFVPNHTSDEHAWFLKSVYEVGNYTDFYVWKDPLIVEGKRLPPNNWISAFSGSAWEWSDRRKKYYLHQFAKQQPDLNYNNPLVVQAMLDVLRFWLDKGVDGFRMDAVGSVFEDPQFRDEPRSGNPRALPTDPEYLDHIYTSNMPQSYELIRTFRALMDTYSHQGQIRMLMTESYSGNISKIMDYYGNSTDDGANFPFNFLAITDLSSQSNATSFTDVIRKWYENMPPKHWADWVLGNHDQPRVATRYGPELSDGLSMVTMLLPGTPVTYNGEELGMENTFMRWDQTVDPQGVNVGPKRYKYRTRDPQRSPFQWDNTTSAGFSSNRSTWLPVNPNYWRSNLQQQQCDTNSHFKIYKRIVALREEQVVQEGDLDIYTYSDWVFGFARYMLDQPTYVVVINLGSNLETVNVQVSRKSLPDKMYVHTASLNAAMNTGQELSSSRVVLRPKAAVVLSTNRPSAQDNKKYQYITFNLLS